MTKKELERFRKLIDDEKRSVLEKIEMLDEEIQGLTSSQSGKQSYSNHMADTGSESMDQEQAFRHAGQGADYLVELEEALRRIDKGTYGVCEECGDKIPPRRLEAFLAASQCVKCKSKLEKLHRG